jgi:aerobic carbon-monoxide dehydrogenase medium subunit
VGYYQTTLEPDELITELAVPVQPEGVQGSYTKFTAISAEDWPALGIAVFLRQEGGRLSGVRIAMSAATERPLRLSSIEEMLDGEQPAEELFVAAADAAAAAVEPLPDGASSVAYKREMIRVHIRRALEKTMRASPAGAP